MFSEHSKFLILQPFVFMCAEDTQSLQGSSGFCRLTGTGAQMIERTFLCTYRDGLGATSQHRLGKGNTSNHFVRIYNRRWV